MKRFGLICLLALVALFTYQVADAQFVSPGWGYGIEGGIAKGANGGPETWQPQFRGYLQNSIMSQLGLQVGFSYTELEARNIYSTQTAMVDARLLFSPFQFMSSYPYVYAGAGVSKDWGGAASTEYLPVIPIGLGLETAIGQGLNLQLNGGYNLVLSDELDGRVRNEDNLNSITNGRQDAYYNLMVGLVYSGPIKSLDPDRDGLFNEDEKLYGTNPDKADTDGDGLNDGEEHNIHNTNPLLADSDKDGLSDGDEINRYDTNPLVADTDKDGLVDGEEVNLYHSNPKIADSDHDTIADGIEVNQYRTDPNKADTDGDGLSDADEINKHHSDPVMADSDNDGLKDADEIAYHSNPLVPDTDNDGLSDGDEVNRYKTDPSKADTDGDGLSDADELNKHRTNPLLVDSDDGGMNDGAEITAKRNPLDAKDDLFDMSKGTKIVLNGINFDTNKYAVLATSEVTLEKARASMAANPDALVTLSGYTDSVGSDDANRTLSLKRAQSVKDWLVANGIPASRIKVVGMGEAEPIGSNETAEGRAQNRRMEFAVR
ncbi:OmpA family protein [bacterium]|nr:OmpA family protein [bacterium]